MGLQDVVVTEQGTKPGDPLGILFSGLSSKVICNIESQLFAKTCLGNHCTTRYSTIFGEHLALQQRG